MIKRRIIIAGPTASGKTELSLRAATRLGAEIISVDSRQCYRFLDIGTAKPGSPELARVPHYNVSVLDPSEKDSAARFSERAGQYVTYIESKGKRVLFCGGSTLHLQSLIQPLDHIPESDPIILEELSEVAAAKGIESLYEELLQADPDYAGKMDGKNYQRIIRALSVWKQTGIPFSHFHTAKSVSLPKALDLFLIHRERAELHERISERTDRMIRDGFTNEVIELLKMGYQPKLQSLRTVGYKEAIAYLQGDITHTQMVSDIKTATRRYAKRQITWFRKWDFATVLNLSELSMDEAVNQITEQVAAKEQKP
ncbi:MAG: tRNA (adenosine(37)-N6)-dimethylallyltransferase MiaA [Balneolaceae bacterium]|nr:MAG: tRNA (adenosine(37)-N6)-dimethylallyltransferase MiaA [Balneolaceae bacterium]